jgi:acyl dehydratase
MSADLSRAPGTVTSPTWSDLSHGDAIHPFVDSPLTITDFVRYQGAANDQNPMHHDTKFAERAGYPGPFAVGMRQAGVLADHVVSTFGAQNVRRFAVRFREQAWPGDILTYRATVAALRDTDGRREVDLEMTVTRQTGGVHITGRATFVVP